jgi:hypothetical protein
MAHAMADDYARPAGLLPHFDEVVGLPLLHGAGHNYRRQEQQPRQRVVLPRPVSGTEGIRDREAAQWWASMQQICESSEQIANETDELVREIAEWSSVMNDMLHGHRAPPESLPREQAAQWRAENHITGEAIAQLEQLEQTNSRMRGVFFTMFSLWKIASQRQNSLLETNRRLLGRLLASLLMQQMSVHHDRISQSLCVDPDDAITTPQASIMSDVASLEVIAANLSALLTHMDLLSFSSCSRSAHLPGETALGSNTPDFADAELRVGMVPTSLLQPGAMQNHDPSTMPMPRFSRSHVAENAGLDPELVSISL